MAFSPDAKTIIIAIPIRMGGFYSRVVRAFERYASAYGYRIVSTTIGHLNEDNAGPDFAAILTYPISAVVLVDVPETFQPTISALCPPGWPIVSVGVFTMPSVDSVTIKLESGVTDAIRYLLDIVTGTIAFFGPGISDEMTVLGSFSADANLETRIAVYTKQMREHNRRVEVIAGNPGSRRESATALREYMSMNVCPGAIFCFNDDMAITANSVLHSLGISVPHETLLIGCDGLEELEDFIPPLSSVEQPFTQLCARSLELLERRMEQPDSALQHVDLDAQFVQRESTMR
jgi:LacI family transcriptional regulator